MTSDSEPKSKPMWNDPNGTFSVVLLGGGHANTQVINSIDRSSVPSHIRLILVSDYERAFYSGMVPGFVARLYSEDEISLNLSALCKARGWEFICARVSGVNSKERVLLFEDGDGVDGAPREPLHYDVLSINCGSSTLGCSVADQSESSNMTCTRPLSALGSRLRAIDESVFGITQNEEEVRANSPPVSEHRESKEADDDGASRSGSRPIPGKRRLVCVGGGAAGCEMAMALQTRWKDRCSSLAVTMIAKSFLAERQEAVRAKLRAILAHKDIDVVEGCSAEKSAEKENALVCKDTGKVVEYDVLVWATGAGAHEFISKNSDLKLDARGWIEVAPTLQSLSAPEVFAAGDCCTFPHLENPPAKAGVFAVREGPFLIHNILAFLKGEALNKYVPQSDFLTLIMTGDGAALGSKFGHVFHGKFVWYLKDRIDRKWMKSFDVGGNS